MSIPPEVLAQMRKTFEALSDAFAGMLKSMGKNPMPPETNAQNQSIQPVASQATLPAPVTPKGQPSVLQLLLGAIKTYEGYVPPGGTDAQGNVYIKGSPAYRNNNPGNLRCATGDNKNWNRLAVACANGFCVFSSFQDGYQALENVVRSVAMGQSLVYNAQARTLFGVGDGSELTLAQYFVIRDPVEDGNNPHDFAQFCARQMGVDSSTFQMKHLLS